MIERRITPALLARLKAGTYQMPLTHALTLGPNIEVWQDGSPSCADALLTGAGIERHSYLNIWQLPPPEWRSARHDFVRALFPKGLATKDGREARDPWMEYRLWPWPDVDSGKRDNLIQTQLSGLAGWGSSYGTAYGETTPFLDMAFTEPWYWMFGPDGPSRAEFDSDLGRDWRKRIVAYLERLVRRAPCTIVNNPLPEWGQTLPHAVRVYIEHAEWDWLRAVARWLAGGPNQHILSVASDNPRAVEELLAEYDAHPNYWISFTRGSEAQEDAAYAEAARIG